MGKSYGFKEKNEGLVFRVSLRKTVLFYSNGYGGSSPRKPLYGIGSLKLCLVNVEI